MKLNNIKKIHIIGIGGCASSAIAEYLTDQKIIITGSEFKKREDLGYLEKKEIKIFYSHDKENIHFNKTLPDLVLFTPAIISLNPNNPELLESKKLNILCMSWEEFIGDYLNTIGKTGITVSGSEGKGTTAGILTVILKGTSYDPLSILGAKIKGIKNGMDSNICLGKGKTYILEGDEYNRNFHNYHPSINITVNLQYEHPETYKDFNEYKESFYHFFTGMQGEKLLILRATQNLFDLVNQYNLNKSHNIIWFGDINNSKLINKCDYIITNHSINEKGNKFSLKTGDNNMNFNLPALPGYMVYNATGAIIAALKLELSFKDIQNGLNKFKGMVRRYDIYRTKNNGIIISDYGHSPEAIGVIIKETRDIFPDKKIHLIFQPHLFSRTYNFFNAFIEKLQKADRISLIDIYPAREKETDWIDKISSYTIHEKLKSLNVASFYAGKSNNIENTLIDKIDENEITIFIGAGDMDQYYPKILNHFKASND